VITDIDETLKQLLIKKVPLKPGEVDICFEMPDREWSAKSTRPRVNFYLYDIRENHELREFDWTVERNGNKTATKKTAPIRVDLSYLVTVWTNAIEDEHRLLWYVMAALFRHPNIPEDLFQGELKGHDLLLNTQVAQPDGVLKNPADFWGAMDNRLKPAINYVITVPLDLEYQATAPIVRSWILRLHGEGNLIDKEWVQIEGMVCQKGKPERGIAGATLLIKETGGTANTDELGRFAFGRLSQGNYTVRVSAPDRKEREIALTIPGKSYDIEI